MKGFLSLLLILSIALNIGFLTGCALIHDKLYGNSCNLKMVEFESIKEELDQAKRDLSEIRSRQGGYGKAQLERIAQLLDIPTRGKSASDLEGDIRDKLDQTTAIPSLFDPDAFEKMARDLNPKEEPAMREYQRFITDLQGKRVIVIEPER